MLDTCRTRCRSLDKLSHACTRAGGPTNFCSKSFHETDSTLPFGIRGALIEVKPCWHVYRVVETGRGFYSGPWRDEGMRRLLIIIAAVMMLAVGAVAQEGRSEISLQGTGFFTKDSNGNGNLQRSTDTGGFMVGYRYHINRWLSAEGNYGYDRNTQQYFGTLGETHVQANAHAVTGDLTVKLPLPIKRVSPYALAGGG